MNWNNTQFDGFEPITIPAVRQVGKILKHTGARSDAGALQVLHVVTAN